MTLGLICVDSVAEDTKGQEEMDKEAGRVNGKELLEEQDGEDTTGKGDIDTDGIGGKLDDVEDK